jgi:phosphate transport system substrate-binding protein
MKIKRRAQRGGKNIMKKNSKMILAAVGTAVMAAGMLAGCGSSSKETTAAQTTTAADSKAADTTEAKKEEKTEAAADLSGTISMVGSTSMEKFANALSETFMEKYPKVTVTAEFVGSGAGVEAAANGTADIGNASRNLKDEEKAKGIAENIVAIDGIAVVVDPSNTVEDLTKDQLAGIYDGTVTNWKDVGGNDAPIVVVGRESGSGTRTAFEELLELEDKCKYANELDSTGAVMAKVASTPGAVGYVSLDVLDDTVKAVKLEGAEPTEENIKAGTYFLSRPFVMATKGEISEQNDLVKALFDFIYSEEGAELVKSVGLISVEK